MKKQLAVATIIFSVLISACSTSDSSLAPEKLSDQNWKNGVWIQKDGKNGFFVTGDVSKIKIPVTTKLLFAKSGERVVTEVSVSGPYINIFVDKPLDPEGDGWPNKVTIASN